jgi:hypothetical protein
VACATNRENAGAESEAGARAEAQARDVLAGLRTLGCKGERAQRAVEHCLTLPDCTLEQRMRAALLFLRPQARCIAPAPA